MILMLPVLIGPTVEDSIAGVASTTAMLGLAWVCAVVGAGDRAPTRTRRGSAAAGHARGALLLLGLAYWLGVPLETGAFLAGLAMSRFPVSGLVGGQLGSLSDFFLAVFFVTLGVLFGTIAPDLKTFEVLFNGVLLASILLLALLLVPLARQLGLTTRSSIEVTNLLAQSASSVSWSCCSASSRDTSTRACSE